MVATIRFTPLCGCGPDDPVCGLLEFEGVTLLIDCGWDGQFDTESLELVRSVLPSVDAVLLSHHSLQHLGALPYLVASCGLEAPIFATLPVQRMGALTLQDICLAKRASADFAAFSLEDVSTAFEGSRWRLLRYFQRMELPARAGGGGVAITPYAAGHLIGGTVWRLVGKASGEEVVYATDWCHKRERHLNACQLVELFPGRPALLIADAMGALAPSVDAARRDVELLDVLVATLRGDGCVLIPCDSAGRLLELALLLDEFWAQEKYDRVYPLALVSPVSKAVAEAARSQLEWMSDSVGKAFEMGRNNPFNFRCLRTLNRADQLSTLQAGPKVVLASQPDLEAGPAKQLFLDWAGDEKNTVVFVQRPPLGSLADAVLRHVAGPEPQVLSLSLQRRVPLEGAELEAWEAAKGEAELAALAAATAQQQPQSQQPQSQQVAGAVGPAAGLAGVGAAAGGAPPGGPFAQASGSASAAAVGVAGGQAGPLMPPLPTGLLPLRSNSSSISCLVKDPVSGLMMQQLGSPRASSFRGQGQGAGAGAEGAAAGSQAQAPMALDVLMDGFVPPQGAAYPMFPDEDMSCQWDDYGEVIDRDAFAKAAAASSAKGGAIAGALASGGRGSGGRRSPGRDRRDQDRRERDGDRGRRGGRDRGPQGMEVDKDADKERSSQRAESSGSEDEEEEEERPTKVVEEEVEVTVRAAIRYFPYEGLCDGKILRKSLSEVAPRSLVLLRGASAAGRQELAGWARKELAGLGTRTATPGAGETVDASAPDAHSLFVSDALHLATIPHKLGGGSGASVALVHAVVGQPDPHHPNLLQLLPGGGAGRAGQQLPTSQSDMEQDAAHDLHEGAQGWLGDVFFADGPEGIKLSQIKQALADAGIPCVWVGPGVISAGPMVISKAGGVGAGEGQQGSKGHLVIEGAVVAGEQSELMHRVRSVIYAQYSACA